MCRCLYAICGCIASIPWSTLVGVAAAVGGGFAVPDDDAADDVFPEPAAPKLDVIAALLRSYAAGRGAFARAEASSAGSQGGQLIARSGWRGSAMRK